MRWQGNAVQLAEDLGAKMAILHHFEMFEFNTVSPELFINSCKDLDQPHKFDAQRRAMSAPCSCGNVKSANQFCQLERVFRECFALLELSAKHLQAAKALFVICCAILRDFSIPHDWMDRSPGHVQVLASRLAHLLAGSG